MSSKVRHETKSLDLEVRFLGMPYTRAISVCIYVSVCVCTCAVGKVEDGGTKFKNK